MRLLVPDVEAARALAQTWAEGASPVSGWETATLAEAERSLRAGHADLGFVPTLSVLRDPEAFSVVPGVGLVGGAAEPVWLTVHSALDAIQRVGFDPRYAQEVLLAQVILKELYQAKPAFVPLAPGKPAPSDLDAVLQVGSEEPSGGYVMNLGHEWFELTTRPFVWALLAAPVGTVEPHEARLLQDAALDLAPEPDALTTDPSVGGMTLAGWAHAGLDEWVNHLFYHGTLADMPQIPFVVVPVDDEEA